MTYRYYYNFNYLNYTCFYTRKINKEYSGIRYRARREQRRGFGYYKRADEGYGDNGNKVNSSAQGGPPGVWPGA